jgi:hypothetical protein
MIKILCPREKMKDCLRIDKKNARKFLSKKKIPLVSLFIGEKLKAERIIYALRWRTPCQWVAVRFELYVGLSGTFT